MTVVVHTRAELVAQAIAPEHTAVVMTMGALHAGHARLVQEARSAVGASGRVVVTVFVNPTQFGPGEDFDRYPRTLEADVQACSAAGADVVFAPSVAEMYGRLEAPAVMVDPGPLGDILEGASRPGHFRGVLTVVAKLLHLAGAGTAFFGEKDYQQLTLITRMVEDLRFPVRIVGVPTVREPDGLALSSRNRYLDPAERALAATLPQALRTVVEQAPAGAAAAVAAGMRVLDRPGIDVDYLVVTDPMLGPLTPGPARVLAAVRIGTTRLIDNMPCEVGAP